MLLGGSSLAVVFSLFLSTYGQQYDFAAEITRQCLVPDPVGLLDCVENRVDLPYMKAWVECTNSLGENVATSRDIINYRCKSVWEGKGVIPEVFYIKDCVIEKMGLPGPNVSAIILGAYKECERSAPAPSNHGKKNTPAPPNVFPVQQQLFVPQVPPQMPQVQPQMPQVQPQMPQVLPQMPYIQPQMPQQWNPPSSRQYFTLYPSAPLPVPQRSPQQLQQQHFYQPANAPQANPITQQQIYLSSANFQPFHSQRIPSQQPLPAEKTIVSHNSPNAGAYYYAFTATHPRTQPQKM